MRDRDHALLPKGSEIALLTLVIIGIGTSGPLIALSTMPVLILIFWRNLGGALLMLPFAIRETRSWDREYQKSILFAAVSGVILAGHFIGFFIAVRYTSVAAGTALTALQPLFTALILKSIGGYIPRRAWLGMSVSFTGVLIVTGVDFQISTRAFLGDLAAIGCALLAAIYVVVGAKARERLSTPTYTGICYLVCSLVALVTAVISGLELFSYPSREWLILFALIIGAQVLGHTIMNFMLQALSPAIVSLVVFFEVPVSAILAFWWLDQLPTSGTVPGLLLILMGCAIFVLRTSKADAEPNR